MKKKATNGSKLADEVNQAYLKFCKRRGLPIMRKMIRMVRPKQG